MKNDSASTNVSADKMSINILMFYAFKKDIIVSNAMSTNGVVVKGVGVGLRTR